MKRTLTILSSALCLVLAISCGQNGNKNKKAAQTVEKTEAQIMAEAVVKSELDSLAGKLVTINPIGVVGSVKDGKVVLSDKEKQVKPEYLAAPSAINDLQTLAQKYNAVAILGIDAEIAKLYDMNVADYEAALAKLYVDINDPALKAFTDGVELKESLSKFYDESKANGREEFFWSAATTSIVEQTYIASQNIDKFIVAFDDQSVTDFTWDIVLLTTAIEDLAKVNPDYASLDASIAPLKKIDAISVAQFKEQLVNLKDEISAARATLLK